MSSTRGIPASGWRRSTMTAPAWAWRAAQPAVAAAARLRTAWDRVGGESALSVLFLPPKHPQELTGEPRRRASATKPAKPRYESATRPAAGRLDVNAQHPAATSAP